MAKIMLVMPGTEAGKFENVQVTIGKMKVKQLKKALKKIQEVVNLIQSEESTSDLISYFMNMEETPEDSEAVFAEDVDDSIFLNKVMGAIKILFNKIPDEITELMAIISGIEEDMIDEQDYDVLFDIAEAILQENDIKTMMDRAKSTFSIARMKWGGLKAIKG